ncbi:hypothetical protein AB6A40_007042 [Gnathostoma spinigerum]|uniref:Uncharacterized protein n=1 Tax=Gnathostoma spinigerum TaxID=75299 RepID=A0ABD6EK29_9BILA
MRLSIPRLFAQFVRNADHVTNNLHEFRRNVLKFSGANILFHISFALLIEEFGFPTPDVVYDIRQCLSPDFAQFARHGNLVEHDLRISNAIRTFHFAEKEMKSRFDEVDVRGSKFLDR